MKLINVEEIKKEIARSKKSLKAAQNLFESFLLQDAISRSYYAVLHAAKAVLLSDNVQVGSHEAVKRLFGLHLIRAGKIDPKYSKILREEQDDRFLADYDVAFDPEMAHARQRVEDAQDFLDAMLQYLEQNNVQID